VDHAFRAVFVPPGNHAVKFIYAPVSFRIGLFGALASGVYFLSIGFLRVCRLKKSARVS
jgi:hypothetical protein